MSRFRPDFNAANIGQGGSIALPRPMGGAKGSKLVKPLMEAVRKPIAAAQDRIAEFNRAYPERIGGILAFLGVYLTFQMAAVGELISALAGGAYIPVVGVMAAIASLAYLVSRDMFAFFRTSLWKPWILFGIWFVLSTAFSTYLTGSFATMWPYILRTFVLPWFICAAVSRAKHIRYLLYCGAAAQGVILLICTIWGTYQGGRFFVPIVAAFGNPNDLALTLLVIGSFMLLLLYRGKFFRKTLCFIASAATLIFVFRTGSRANFMTVLFVAGVVLLFAPLRARLTALIIGPVLAAILVVALPASTWTRLTFVFLDPTGVNTDDPTLQGALGSQVARTELQLRAIQLSVRNPLFGVGPSTFADQVERLTRLELGLGRSGWQQAHNAYLEVAAEMGIPGFIAFTWSMLAALVMAIKSMRRCSREPALRDYFAQSLCLSLAASVYTLGLYFSNFTYYSFMPIIIGLISANALALNREAQLAREIEAAQAS